MTDGDRAGSFGLTPLVSTGKNLPGADFSIIPVDPGLITTQMVKNSNNKGIPLKICCDILKTFER